MEIYVGLVAQLYDLFLRKPFHDLVNIFILSLNNYFDKRNAITHIFNYKSFRRTKAFISFPKQYIYAAHDVIRWARRPRLQCSGASETNNMPGSLTNTLVLLDFIQVLAARREAFVLKFFSRGGKNCRFLWKKQKAKIKNYSHRKINVCARV